ncbi:hypothetical protein SD71_15465 [Cohnella kolymensis]|uniref:Uncharacterized protein n=1 Tax=Cohnella kolymensis TaxID=1590652 RepID=A0ABR5A1W1_9BACL|nr:hypothetical protein [Cohnella kolymensis]KIL35057.1 hypothetical protein SD71_15465 [Cohnella kolymensis]
MRELSDLLFFISLGLIVLAFFAATLLGPRVIRGADGLPLDDNTEILARQDKGIKKSFSLLVVMDRRYRNHFIRDLKQHIG